MSNTKPRITLKIVEKAFSQWLLGYSLRKLESIYGFSRCSFSIYFRRIYGEDYAKTPRLKGTIHIFREYLADKRISRRDREQIKEFLERNFDSMFEVDFANRHTSLYTDKEMYQKTFAECSAGKHDFRFIFENVDFNGTQVA